MSKLSYLRNSWKSVQPMQSSEYDTPENGTYKCLIEDIEYTERDRNGNETDPTFIYIFNVLEGNYKNTKFRKFTTLKTESNLSFFKGDLAKLGLPIPVEPEELPAVHRSARGLIVQVTVKSREYNGKIYKDVYFDRLIGRQQAPQVQGRPHPADYYGQPATGAQNAPQTQGYPHPVDYYGQPSNGYSETSYNSNAYDGDVPF